jgi:aspartate aminotransferase
MTFAISDKAKRLKAEGLDVCDFSVGEPDFVTPAHIREAAKDALDAGMTKYAPTAGLPALRDHIAAKLRSENGLSCTADQILVTTGGKQALYNSMMATLNPGDEVVIPAPYWVTYPEIVKLAGATPVPVPTTSAAGFKLTAQQLEAAITPRTRAMILNSPANPTGAVYTRAELEALAEVILDHDLMVVADEIYEKLIYDGEAHVSLAGLDPRLEDRTLTCNGFSKAYAATGWRLGYVAGPKPVIQAATAIQSHSTSGANTFAQYGAITALTGPQDAIVHMRETFRTRRELIVAEVSAIPGVECRKPEGAFYAFPDIASTGLDSLTFCERLLDEQYVAAVPGGAFGADAHIRLSYATDMETIKRGIARLRAFVTAL